MVQHIEGILQSKVFYFAMTVIVAILLGICGAIYGISNSKLDKSVYERFEARQENRHIRIMEGISDIKICMAGGRCNNGD